jgi:hypothetical protein
MPTILINTNLTKSAAAAVAAVSGQENQDDVLRQDINSIISKLLSKSESVTLFFCLLGIVCASSLFIYFRWIHL